MSERRSMRQKEQGLFSKKQAAEITGYAGEKISRAIENRVIVPAVSMWRKDGKSRRPFFSAEQIEKLKELKAEEARQVTLFAA